MFSNRVKSSVLFELVSKSGEHRAAALSAAPQELGRAAHCPLALFLYLLVRSVSAAVRGVLASLYAVYCCCEMLDGGARKQYFGEGCVDQKVGQGRGGDLFRICDGCLRAIHALHSLLEVLFRITGCVIER